MALLGTATKAPNPWNEDPKPVKRAPLPVFKPAVPRKLPVPVIPQMKPAGVPLPKAPAKPKPTGKPYDAGAIGRKLTEFETYLNGDATYLQQYSGLNKAKSNFLADQNLDKSSYTQGYGNTRRDLGLAQTEQNRDLKDEYAGRGLLKSGIFGNALGDMSREFTNQYGDLDKQKATYMARLQREAQKFTDEQNIAKQQAVADAARRRAENMSL